MTMNLWILASVLVGGGVGYFLFRPWLFTKKVKNGNGNIIQVRGTTKLYGLVWIMVFNATFNNISVIATVSFIGGEKRSTRRKP
jgi:hypothetical protein